MAEFSALIMAGGRATRFGGTDLYKEKLGGKSMFSHALDLCDADEDCVEVLVSVGKEMRGWIAGDVLTFSSSKLKLVDSEGDRQSSVLAAMRQASSPLVAILDGNRPYVNEDLLVRVLREVAEGTGCAACLDCTDPPALRGAEISADSGEKDFFGAEKTGSYARHMLAGNLQSGPAVLLQHPQAYRRDDYIAKAEAAGDLSRFADDTEVFMAGGGEVVLVPGRHGNFRVASRGDLKIMQKIMGGPSKGRKDGKYGGLGW